MKTLFIIIAPLSVLLAAQAYASPALDLGVLRDAICHWETRGERHPDETIGNSGEVGFCQIRISTARFLGFKGTGRDLMNRQTNMKYAVKWLKYCYRRGMRTVGSLAGCYNSGVGLGLKWYIKQIRSDYAERYKLRHGPGIRLAMK